MDFKTMKLAADTIRALSADAIQKAKSGHPGTPLGCADFALMLFYRYLRHNPHNPQFWGRDRFVLSAGHGSMLLYSLMHLFDYGVTLEELKNFRQWGSRTAGHPEYGVIPGVEITTGPLGSGFSSAVGMAMAAKNFGARTGLDQAGLADQKIYVISGDGCMMEGCTSESASLAGHLKLDNLIVFYDSNAITIEGGTDLACSENVGARFAAYNWRVITIENANDLAQCDAGLAEAQKSDGRPTLIIGHTKIGFGAPNKQGKNSSHGEPLGEEEVAALKANLGVSPEAFFVPEEVRSFCLARTQELERAAAEYDKKFQAFLAQNTERAKLIARLMSREIPADLKEKLIAAAGGDQKPAATRASGGVMLNIAAAEIPALIGGSADLAPSTKTIIKDGGEFSVANYAARNIHFGVREFAMGLAANGMGLFGTAIPFVSTFLVFSDYLKPAIRFAALMKLKEIFIFTHDSFYVGEDGPTHEPVEQIATLRAIPGLAVFRPADVHECAEAYAEALKLNGPSVILLTRQNVPVLDAAHAAKVDVAKGAYVLDDEEDFDLILIATGSEVPLALQSAVKLRELHVRVRVVSMPSQELFLAQDREYRESVLPPDADCGLVSLEAGSSFGWARFIGDFGLAISLDHFGASAPASVLAEKFGFTPDGVVARIADYFLEEEDGCTCGCHEEDDCHCGCHESRH